MDKEQQKKLAKYLRYLVQCLGQEDGFSHKRVWVAGCLDGVAEGLDIDTLNLEEPKEK